MVFHSSLYASIVGALLQIPVVEETKFGSNLRLPSLLFQKLAEQQARDHRISGNRVTIAPYELVEHASKSFQSIIDVLYDIDNGQTVGDLLQFSIKLHPEIRVGREFENHAWFLNITIPNRIVRPTIQELIINKFHMYSCLRTPIILSAVIRSDGEDHDLPKLLNLPAIGPTSQHLEGGELAQYHLQSVVMKKHDSHLYEPVKYNNGSWINDDGEPITGLREGHCFIAFWSRRGSLQSFGKYLLRRDNK
jgi:hypothetical protein